MQAPMTQPQRTQAMASTVMRRLARRSTEADAAVTPSRALRLALCRSAEACSGMQINVLGILDEVLPLDTLLGVLDASLMLVAVETAEGHVGLVGIDLQARAAMIEMQTTGKLRPVPADPRPATRTDVTLMTPWFSAFLDQLVAMTPGTALDGWADGFAVGAAVADLRAAGMLLAPVDYRLVRMTVDLGLEGRDGQIVLALPVSRIALSPAPQPTVDWADRLHHAVMAAPSDLHAVLHRMQLSIAAVEGFEVGQILPLDGGNVAGVRVEGVDARLVAFARLGQAAGMRAVRIEAPAPARLSERAQRFPAASATLVNCGAGSAADAENDATHDAMPDATLPETPADMAEMLHESDMDGYSHVPTSPDASAGFAEDE